MGVIGIELEDAIAMITAHTRPIRETEEVPVLDAAGRVLAREVRAAFDQPPFPRSPLDGYAFAADCVRGAGAANPVVLPVTAAVYAGEYLNHEIPSGEAVKITTGAPIPAGCNCVVRQEDVCVKPGTIEVYSELQPFENYCFAGEDYQKGTVLLSAGDTVRFVEMGILASAGYDRTVVYRRPRAAVFATGDELLHPGGELQPGKIYDSNLYMIYGRLKELGVDVICAEQLADDPEKAAARLREIAAAADVIITTGGVSVGEKDIFHQILPMLACERLFWRVLIKPGTPAMFSVLEGTPMLNLSGNPFAAATTFELLARPMLYRLYGKDQIRLEQVRATLSDDFGKESKGRRFIRAFYRDGAVRTPEVHRHASGMLASMKGCNCLIEIPAETKSLKAGDTVTVLLL